jgi:predicted hydrocarbon binding protein
VAGAKGTAVLQLVKALRSLGEPARRALRPGLHHYLDERVLVTKWYPEEEYIELITTLSQVMPVPDGVSVWDQFGKAAARHDLTSVYKGMVRGGTLLGTLKAARDLWKLYHDTGRIVIAGDEERATFDVFDYASVHAGHCRFLTAYLREHLRMATGRDYEVRETLCRSLGNDRCRREFAQPRPGSSTRR